MQSCWYQVPLNWTKELDLRSMLLTLLTHNASLYGPMARNIVTDWRSLDKELEQIYVIGLGEQ